jgi:hypothetical protein
MAAVQGGLVAAALGAVVARCGAGARANERSSETKIALRRSYVGLRGRG